MRLWSGLVAAGLTLGTPVTSGSAQSPLILDRNRADRIQPVTPTAPDAAREAPAPPAPVVDSGTEQGGTIISAIQFVGTKAPEPAARAAEVYIGKPATRATLQNIAAAISGGYAKSDVALYSVLIPNQTMSDGVLRVLLIEGTVEQVIVTDRSTGRARRLVAAIARQLTAESPLRKSTLQRYVSLIQDVPGTSTDIDIVQGTKQGLVRITLTVRDKKNEFATGFDNRAGATYRGGAFTARATLFHLLRGGDQTDVNLAASVDFRNYRYASFSHSTALGADGGRLGLSLGYLKTRPRRSPISGSAEIAGLTYSFPLIRDYRRNLTLSAGIDGLNSDNAAFGQLIASERTRAARVALGYVEARPKRTIAGGLTVSRGLDMLGARVTAPFAETRFTKLNARASIDQAIGKTLIARVRLSGQYSRDRLPAAERFAVGGEEYGRAFEIALLSADRGAAALAELAVKPLASSKAFGATELYGFVDAAKVRILPRGVFPAATFDLASAGGGMRLAYTTKAALFLEAAKPIDRPFPGYEKDWRFSVGWKLALRS
ncbi:ShlB/FhaC/HecB family hemolysin secretion/activation protein [Rhizorhabdus sp.]|uniref:ShlB/FhaC/HecB family hemolysin secretion/activation protein n=1 Tax=Rhizorhabdus sp. TaxID=1968843 RepID=UPI0019A068AF|nr:ShlB/FhaC/HecB family hemolysin secretion/activation protein [Rhizorhabdus sp.]MBD3759768.1 ShlB/FhaC/HecB family hemolysin secretion/activation protein [Rhizorhabdus sp.]